LSNLQGNTTAGRIGRDPNYIKQNVFRLRKRYREFLEKEVGYTVGLPRRWRQRSGIWRLRCVEGIINYVLEGIRQAGS
jgi:hypothetical protein